MRVRIEQGRLSGVASVDGIVHVFKGIPYAAPPVGALRWRAPQPPPSWEGLRPAQHFGAAPIQPTRPKNTLTYMGDEATSEDCLTLNVWTAGGPGDRRPVMVWIFFGAFLMGSGAGALWDGEALARAGAVVVTLNFRLGRFGFLAHPELTSESGCGASGNYGLLDQIAALQWIQKNIAAFGGDPACVTLFGQSSGASSISLLMASPLAKGLFHRAIAQSGGQFEPPRKNIGWPALSSLLDAEEDGLRLAASLQERSIQGLRERRTSDILRALTPAAPISWREGLVNPAFLCGYPIVDGYVVPPAGVRAVFEAKRHNDVPLLTGSNAREGAGKAGAADLAALRAEAARYGALSDAYLTAFPAATDAEAREASSVAIGDQLFSWQNWAWARLHARMSKSRVYYYHFGRVPAYPPGVRWAETDGDPAVELGAIHGSEIPYVFRNLDKRAWPWKPWDRELSAALSSYWLNFAAKGDPNGAGLPEWPCFEEDGKRTLFFGDYLHVGEAPFQDRLRFWDRYLSMP